MSTYCVVGNMFCMGKTGRTFGGPCVLSPDSIILIVAGDCAQNQLHTDMRGVAGIMDRVQGLVQLVPIPGLDQYEVTMDELTAKVGDDKDWPVEFIGERAFVLPKSSIVRLRYGMLTGLNFSVDGLFRVNVSGGMKQRKAGIAFLQHHGWPLDIRSFMDRLRGRAA